jgi:xanthine/uracil permease
MNQKTLLVDVQEKPSHVGRWIVLSFQHVFAMFGATILVPIITGLDIGVALVASGIGTLIYIALTKAKVPVYLGSSFAYIPAITAAVASTAGVTSAYVGLMVVGIIYAIVATVIRFVGSSWLKKLLPPVVIGPVIIIIGLSLAPVAIGSSGLAGSDPSYYSPRAMNQVDVFSAVYDDFEAGDVMYYYEDGTLNSVLLSGDGTAASFSSGDKVYAYTANPFDGDAGLMIYVYDGNNWQMVSSDYWKIPVVALITFLTVVALSIVAKGFLKIVPFLVAIIVGYIASVVLGVVDLGVVFSGYRFFQFPNFTFIGTYAFNFGAVLMFAPLAFVTIAEHIGDHVVLGEITGKDFIEDPGLQNTLLGDGVATFVSAALGGPANTTYGENTGVIAITRVGSVWVTGLAAVIAVLLGFFGYIQAFIASIPWAVIGGMTIVLYGLIAANGVKILIKDKTDLSEMKNLVIVSTMLVIGLGGASIAISATTAISGMSLAAIVGIILNQVFKLFKQS